MTKQEVLEIFARTCQFIPPDAVCRQLRGFHHRSSVYSYLFRLHKQGLLSRQTAHGRIVYQITQRGIERLRLFRERQHSRCPEEMSGAVPMGETGRQ